MGPTIAALLPLLEAHPGNARVLYEVGGAYDTAGDEETAVGFYERAIAAGLDGDLDRRCAVQYGSTLRNLGRFAESLEVFARARKRHPRSPSLATFEALSRHAAGEADAAFAGLLDVIADHVDSPDLERYTAALRGNAEFLRGRKHSNSLAMDKLPQALTLARLSTACSK
jgi:tetratricopeptide (TPR) repeat protein